MSDNKENISILNETRNLKILSRKFAPKDTIKQKNMKELKSRKIILIVRIVLKTNWRGFELNL